MKEKNKVLLGFFLMALATFAVYSFAVNGSFKTMDDDYSIVRNELIRSFSNLPKIFTTGFFGDQSYYRPLVSVSFMKEYFFFKLNPVPYYINNILIHVINAMLVFGIALTLTRRRRLAMGVMFLFALHPIHWEAVSNIPGRSILLCALYGFGAIYTFLLSYGQTGPKKYLAYLSVLLFALALLCKESAGVLPLLLIAYLYFIKGKSHARFPKLGFTIAPYAIIVLIYLWTRATLGITKTFPWHSLTDKALGFLTFLQSVIIDFGLLLFPVDLYFDRSLPLLTSFVSAGAISTLVFYAIVITILWLKRAEISPLVGLCIAWFWIDLFPVSQLVTTVGVQPGYISTAEHFLYTPSVPFFILLALGFSRFKAVALEKGWLTRPVIRIAVGGTFIFLVIMTIQYNIYARNEISMFERTLEMNPTNNRIRTSLALAYAKVRRYDKAEEHFRKAVFNEPFNARARIGLGKSLVDQGKLWEGLREYELVTDPGDLKELLENNLRNTLLFMISHYERVRREDPNNPRVYHSLGVLHSKLSQPEKAAAQYEKAVELQPDFKEAIFNLAATHEILGNRDMAITLYQRVLELKAGPDELDRLSAGRLAHMARNAPQ